MTAVHHTTSTLSGIDHLLITILAFRSLDWCAATLSNNCPLQGRLDPWSWPSLGPCVWCNIGSLRRGESGHCRSGRRHFPTSCSLEGHRLHSMSRGRNVLTHSDWHSGSLAGSRRTRSFGGDTRHPLTWYDCVGGRLCSTGRDRNALTLRSKTIILRLLRIDSAVASLTLNILEWRTGQLAKIGAAEDVKRYVLVACGDLDDSLSTRAEQMKLTSTANVLPIALRLSIASGSPFS